MTHLTIRTRSAIVFLVLTKTHINPIFFGSLITTDYDPICLKDKKPTVFENVNMFTKLHEPINQGIRPLNLGRRKQKTINVASVSSHIDLKKPCLRILAHAFVIFLQDDKV